MRMILVLFLILLSFSSCGRRQTYWHAYQAIPNDGWYYTDSLCFQIPMHKVDTTFEIQLEVRHHVNYNYKNLPLLVECVEFAKDSILYQDTINLLLMDDNGRWLGKGIGRLLQVQTQLGAFYVAKSDSVQFRVVHSNPDTLLKGISDVGLRLY